MGVTAVACGQRSPSAPHLVSLPPTTTPIPLPQNTVASQPETTQEAALTPTSTITPTATMTRTAVTYTIQPGDTLATISGRFEVPIKEIAEANNLTNPNTITAGQTLLFRKKWQLRPFPPLTHHRQPIRPSQTPQQIPSLAAEHLKRLNPPVAWKSPTPWQW